MEKNVASECAFIDGSQREINRAMSLRARIGISGNWFKSPIFNHFAYWIYARFNSKNIYVYAIKLRNSIRKLIVILVYCFVSIGKIVSIARSTIRLACRMVMTNILYALNATYLFLFAIKTKFLL